MSIKYKYGHYIDLPEQREILRTASCDSERRRFQAAIITNNCLAKFRGWDDNDKKRERVIESIRNGRLYFSTALGYNDPYDTLMYIDKVGLLKFIEQTLAVQMPAYIESQKIKNFSVGCFAQIYNTPQARQQFVRCIDDRIEKLKYAIHDNIKGICLSQNYLSTLMWAHYAKDHTGIALLYDTKELECARCYSYEGKVLQEKFKLCPIKYRSQRPDATAFIHDYLLSKAAGGLPVTHAGDILSSPDYKVIKDIVLTKDVVWRYEKEVRLIPRVLDFEYMSGVAYLEIKPKAIILGAKMSDCDRKVVIDTATEVGGITIYEAWLNDSQRDYQIVFQEYGL